MKLETYLAETGISPEQFAERIGVNRTTVYRLKSGVQLPTRKVADLIFSETSGLVQANDFYGHRK